VAVEIVVEPESWRSRWYRQLFGPRARRLVFALVIALHVNLLVLVLLATCWLTKQDSQIAEIDFPCTAALAAEEVPPEELTLTIKPPEVPDGLPLAADVIPLPAFTPDAPNIAAPTPGNAAPLAIAAEVGVGLVPSPQLLLTATELKIGGGYEGRTAVARDRLAAARGGSLASERAVEQGLVWLAAHQRDDGGWSFDLRGSKCAGQCSHAGSHQSTTAATALALLAYLGAGQTHRAGEHQAVVDRGLAYLISRIVPSSRGADLQEGTMYAQGLATVALCEAYALTSDPQLREPAQQAIDFIANVQHPLGGWRYFPGQPGDTTVLGWQLMALQSGRLAGLQIPEQTLPRAQEFLDRVQGNEGATYGYQASGDAATPSAVGLLGRMYHGWQRNDDRLRRGVDRLVARGPDLQDLYFTYYATQVLHHYDGPQWQTWNHQLRDRLVAQQAQQGHAAGSWHTPDYHTVAGGRLCDTALAIMILEVYYRHMPLYGYRSIDDF
jgi:hypothetical protein